MLATLHNRLQRTVLVVAVVLAATAAIAATPARADPLSLSGGGPFTLMQAPFTQATWATTPAFLGGIAFAPNGDVWADECQFSGSPLHRFSASATTAVDGSPIHAESVVASDAGCGLTNGPDNVLYSNTGDGISTLDANTGARLALGGPAGNALGIAYNPADHTVAYPDSSCRYGGGCVIDDYDPSTGASHVLAELPASLATFVDGIAFDPSGRYLVLSTRAPSYALTIIDATTGALVRQVPMDDEPDGISFHWTSPQFVVTNNTDGTMTRFDFAGGDLTGTPAVSTFAVGGYRGDLSLVGADGCAYVSQDGTTYADGTKNGESSIVQLCPGFTPSTGVTPPPSGPAAQVLFLHGVTESADDPALFPDLLGALRTKFGSQNVREFEYFQDAKDAVSGGCDPNTPGQQTPPTPDPSLSMPYDSSQNFTYCDSEGDLGQNASRLDAVISSMYNSNGGKKIILIGYSMGGETIRSMLSYSTHLHDGVAGGMVDSVLLMHGVEQGSWIADGSAVRNVPYIGSKIGNLLGKLGIPNFNRPGVQEFAPSSDYMKWVDSNSDQLPDIPYYNTWGDEVVTLKHCFLPFGWGCVTYDAARLGDLVLMPGTDNPTQTPAAGGEKFLPGGASATRWEWAETTKFEWDPTSDPLFIGEGDALLSAPQMHTNLPSQEGKLTVADCQTHQPISEVTELVLVISARMNGTTYNCVP